MQVLKKISFGVGLVVFMTLGCSSEKNTGYTIGQINLFCTNTDLNWDVYMYRPVSIDFTDVSLGGNNKYIDLEDIRSKYEGLDDSLSVERLGEQGASVIFDSIQPGTYDLIIYTSLNMESDTMDSTMDTLPGEKTSAGSQSGYRTIYVAGVTIKAGHISVVNITTNLESRLSQQNSEHEDHGNTVFIKWKEKYLQIEQKSVASSNKAFG